MRDAHQQLENLLEELKVPADLVVEIKKSLQGAVSAENKNSDAQRRELQRGVDKDIELLEALEDELVMPKNLTMDRTRLAERVGKLQREVAKKEARIAELEVEGEVDLDVAFKVLEGLLSNLKEVFDEMLDVDKAAFVFVLLRGKVICKDKRLQTTESLVPALFLDSAKTRSPEWHPQRDSNSCRHLERVESSSYDQRKCADHETCMTVDDSNIVATGALRALSARCLEIKLSSKSSEVPSASMTEIEPFLVRPSSALGWGCRPTSLGTSHRHKQSPSRYLNRSSSSAGLQISLCLPVQP